MARCPRFAPFCGANLSTSSGQALGHHGVVQLWIKCGIRME